MSGDDFTRSLEHDWFARSSVSSVSSRTVTVDQSKEMGLSPDANNLEEEFGSLSPFDSRQTDLITPDLITCTSSTHLETAEDFLQQKSICLDSSTSQLKEAFPDVSQQITPEVECRDPQPMTMTFRQFPHVLTPTITESHFEWPQYSRHHPPTQSPPIESHELVGSDELLRYPQNYDLQTTTEAMQDLAAAPMSSTANRPVRHRSLPSQSATPTFYQQVPTVNAHQSLQVWSHIMEETTPLESPRSYPGYSSSVQSHRWSTQSSPTSIQSSSNAQQGFSSNLPSEMKSTRRYTQTSSSLSQDPEEEGSTRPKRGRPKGSGKTSKTNQAFIDISGMSEEDKIEFKREKARVASQKCRKRKIEEIGALQEQLAFYKNENSRLDSQIATKLRMLNREMSRRC